MNSMRSIANIFGGPERSALDLPVAGLAALALAFAAFTIPDALLGRAVEATGLPTILTAAQPPLGTTARVLLAVSGALAAFVLAFALLRWLDGFAGRPPVPVSVDVAPESDAPRIHRADAHPDAPPRRPISAARDLGEPAPPSRPAVPAFEEVAAASVVRAPPSTAPSASLTDLMVRLERGLAKREGAEPATSSKPDAAPPVPSNDRLQSAIEGLRALSSRA
jgi:hypothetical protein